VTSPELAGVRLGQDVDALQPLHRRQYDVLLKNVGLLRGELDSLPSGGLDDDVQQAILQARALLGSDPRPA
jgi:hypothetical protein